MSVEQRYTAFEKAKNYTKEYELDKVDSIVTKQEDGYLGYISAGQFATTGSNIFEGGQIIDGNLTIAGDIFANTFNVTTTSIEHFTASTNFGIDNGDTHTFTGSVKITGSLNLIGNSTITGSFLVSGSTTQIGNNTLLGNTLLTGSIGIVGNSTLTGSFLVSGSTTQIGNNSLYGNTNLYGTIDVSGSTNFHNHTITMTGSMYTSGSQTITGSLDINGNVNLASGSEFYLAGNKMFNYGQFYDTTNQSGSVNTAYSMKLNSTDFAHNVRIVSGSRIQVDNTGVYNLQFSAQLANTANTNTTFDIWLAYTGSNYRYSNTQVDLNKSAGQLGRAVAAWNWVLPIKANDYVEIKWSNNSATALIYSSGSATNPDRPEIPSVIATITQVG